MRALAFEPHVIETKAEYEAAIKITKQLNKKQHSSQEDTRLLKTWAVLIRDYEQRRYPEIFSQSERREILPIPA
jgi:hypothetical protein